MGKNNNKRNKSNNANANKPKQSTPSATGYTDSLSEELKAGTAINFDVSMGKGYSAKKPLPGGKPSSTSADKAKLAEAALKKIGVQDPKSAMLKGVKKSEGEVKKKPGEDDEENDPDAELSRQDQMAIKDYIKAVSSIYQASNSASTNSPNKAQLSSDRYAKLDGEVAAYMNAELQFCKYVQTSTSGAFSSADMQNAKQTQTIIEQVFGQPGEPGSKARALRFAFSMKLQHLNSVQFPSLPSAELHTREDVLRILNEVRAYGPFAPWEVNDTEFPNPRLKDPIERRGGLDVNMYVELPFLYITPYFKELLKDRGVSDFMLATLGNYGIARVVGDNNHHTFSGNHDFDAHHFTDFGELYPASRDGLRHWAGPTVCQHIQNDLISFIDNVKLKAEAVLAQNTSRGGLAETDLSMKNLFNPDLIVKLWIKYALNAVFKVMVEDGMGAMDRVRANMADCAREGIGATLHDVMAEVASTNILFTEKMNNSARKFLTNGTFKYNKLVYSFLKEYWVTAEWEYKMQNKRFIGNEEYPNEVSKVRVFTKLILPVNPYDSACKILDENMGSTMPIIVNDLQVTYNADGSVKSKEKCKLPAYNVITETTEDRDYFGFVDRFDGDILDRSYAFMSTVLPSAYIDKRTKVDKSDLVVRFDNMLSYFFFITTRNNRYNIHSFGVRGKIELDYYKAGSALSDAVTWKDLSSDDRNNKAWKLTGPTAANWDHFDLKVYNRGELYSSGLGRIQALGLGGSVAFPTLSQTVLRYVDAVQHPDKAAELLKDVKGIATNDDQLLPLNPVFETLLDHTNFYSLRFLSCVDWYSTTPSIINRSIYYSELEAHLFEDVLRGECYGNIVRSTTVGAPSLGASNNAKKALDYNEAVRYSFVYGHDDILGMYDNIMERGKAPALLINSEGDKENPGRLSGIIIRSSASGKPITADMVRDMAVSAAVNAYTPFLGRGHCKTPYVADDHIISKIGGYDLNADNLTSAELENILFSNKYRLSTGALIPHFSRFIRSNKAAGTANNRVCYYRKNEIPAFTKKVALSSYQTYKCKIAQPDDFTYNTGVLSDTWGAGFDAGATSPVQLCGAAVNKWNAIHLDAVKGHVYDTTDFELITDYIFSSFSQLSADYRDLGASGDGIAEGSLGLTRWSASAVATIGTYANGNGKDAIDDILFVAAPQIQAVTGVGAVFGPPQYGDPEATQAYMRKLGLVVLDSVSGVMYNYMTKGMEEISVGVSTKPFDMNYSKRLYISPLPDIDDPKGHGRMI